jgi:hypothetical protein
MRALKPMIFHRKILTDIEKRMFDLSENLHESGVEIGQVEAYKNIFFKVTTGLSHGYTVDDIIYELEYNNKITDRKLNLICSDSLIVNE